MVSEEQSRKEKRRSPSRSGGSGDKKEIRGIYLGGGGSLLGLACQQSFIWSVAVRTWTAPCWFVSGSVLAGDEECEAVLCGCASDRKQRRKKSFPLSEEEEADACNFHAARLSKPRGAGAGSTPQPYGSGSIDIINMARS